MRINIGVAEAFLACCLLMTVHMASAQEPIWKADFPSATAYMIGATHLGKRTREPLGRKAIEIMVKANYLGHESSGDEPQNSNQQRFSQRKRLSNSAVDRLSAFLSLCEAPETAIGEHPAGAIIIACEQIILQSLGGAYMYGTKAMVAEYLAMTKNQPVTGFLETKEVQIEAIQSISDDDWEQSTIYRLGGLKRSEIEAAFTSILNIKATTDCENSRSLIWAALSSPAEARIQEALLKNRNIGMADELIRKTSEHKISLFVFGADHAYGEFGILEILRQNGARIFRWNEYLETWKPSRDHIDCEAP